MKIKTFRRILAVLLCSFILLLFPGCQTNLGPMPGALPVHVWEVFSGGGLFDIIVTTISLADPDIGEDTIRSLLQEINEDPDLIIYWVPSSNHDVSNLSYQSALLNGSIVFAEYALRRSAAAMKGSARAGMAADTVEQIGEEESYTLTEEEQAALEARAAELSDEERAEMKKCFVYLSCASASLAKVPFTAAELLKQTSIFIQQPERLISDPFAAAMLIPQLFSINDNLSSVGKQSKGLIKNVNANIVVLKAIQAANKEAREAEAAGNP